MIYEESLVIGIYVDAAETHTTAEQVHPVRPIVPLYYRRDPHIGQKQLPGPSLSDPRCPQRFPKKSINSGSCGIFLLRFSTDRQISKLGHNWFS